MCVCVYVCVCVSVCLSVCVCVSVCVSVCQCMYVHARVCVCVWGGSSVSLSVCNYCTLVNLFIYIYIDIYVFPNRKPCPMFPSVLKYEVSLHSLTHLCPRRFCYSPVVFHREHNYVFQGKGKRE